MSAVRSSLATSSRATASASLRLGLAAGVEEEPRPVARDDHAAAEPLACLVVERVRAQAFADPEAVGLVGEVDLHAPFVLHGTR